MALADTARLRTSPNPWVGAVVVADGRIVARGATEPPGGAHAERTALDEAAGSLTGATLVTTLEPCDHEGRTGPCTEATMASGVALSLIHI